MPRRFAYLITAILLLLLMSLPIFAFMLAARGELMIGNEQGSYLRLYMVNEDQAEGIGIQRVKQSAADPNCLQGSVRYYLWSGQSQELDADYCTCLDAQGGPVTSPGRCPERP